MKLQKFMKKWKEQFQIGFVMMGDKLTISNGNYQDTLKIYLNLWIKNWKKCSLVIIDKEQIFKIKSEYKTKIPPGGYNCLVTNILSTIIKIFGLEFFLSANVMVPLELSWFQVHSAVYDTLQRHEDSFI